MKSFDDGPLQLAYQATIPGAPDATKGHYKIVVAQSKTEQIGTQSTYRIGSSYALGVGTSFNLNVGATATAIVGADSLETIRGGRYMHVAKEIDLRCGNSRFLMKRNGEIEITGVRIKLRAGKIELN